MNKQKKKRSKKELGLCVPRQRMFRYQKIVDNLKNKSLKELDEMMKEIEKKGESDEESSSVSRGK